MTATWGAGDADRTHWINAFNAPEALGRRDGHADSCAALQETFIAVGALGNSTELPFQADGITLAPECTNANDGPLIGGGADLAGAASACAIAAAPTPSSRLDP